jgi:hypothetical protein
VGEVGKVGGELEADRDALGVPALNDAQRNEVRAYSAVRETDTAMSVVGALALAPQVEGPAQITGAQIEDMAQRQANMKVLGEDYQQVAADAGDTQLVFRGMLWSIHLSATNWRQTQTTFDPADIADEFSAIDAAVSGQQATVVKKRNTTIGANADSADRIDEVNQAAATQRTIAALKADPDSVSMADILAARDYQRRQAQAQNEQAVDDLAADDGDEAAPVAAPALRRSTKRGTLP